MEMMGSRSRSPPRRSRTLFPRDLPTRSHIAQSTHAIASSSVLRSPLVCVSLNITCQARSTSKSPSPFRGRARASIRRAISGPFSRFVAVVDLAYQAFVRAQARDDGGALEHRIGASAEVPLERNVYGDGLDAVDLHFTRMPGWAPESGESR